jgi:AcrR family transcriptional regulator
MPFADKEALFTAVVMRSVSANVARFEAYTPTGATIEQRRESVAVTVLEWILLSDSIGLMRVAIAEAAIIAPPLSELVWGAFRTSFGLRSWRGGGGSRPQFVARPVNPNPRIESVGATNPSFAKLAPAGARPSAFTPQP